jgi:hypothetical protein
MDQADFPWRPLGTLLVDEELLTPAALERALAEQRRAGRLLGQILVAQGYVSGIELARVLARQHGVELRPARGRDSGRALTSSPEPATEDRPWRSLGMLLIQKGFVTAASLQKALAEQRERPERRLGEILVEHGNLSAPTLASVLAEQHGVDVEPEALVGGTQAAARSNAPTYEVCVVAYEPTRERTPLYESSNLLDAADFACEYVDRVEPVAVEIERRDGQASETVWTYSRDRAVAAAASSKSLLETFGFDPTRWGA